MTATPYFPELAETFLTALRELQGRRVAVLGHMRPDGDCIGTQVAMTRLLQSLGIEAVAVNGDEIPRSLDSLTEETRVLPAEDFDPTGWTAVTVDCAGRNRTGAVLEATFPDVFLNLDHHISNPAYAKYNLIDAHSAASSEILAGLILDHGMPLDAITAQALYYGIATDTGQFRHGTTTARVFALAEALTHAGADPAAAADELYERESIAKIKLLQRFLASLQFYANGRVCIGLLTAEDWAATGARKEDTEGLVDYARAIDGVEIGVLLEEREGSSKGSFRARHPRHRVDQIAKGFRGGGHACAAGFNPGEPMATVLPRLISTLEGHFAALDAQTAPAS